MHSAKRIMEVLDATPDEAKEVRAILDMNLVEGDRTEREADSPEYEIWHDEPSRKLYMVNRVIRENGSFHGVEILQSRDDTHHSFEGISYLNAGDPYVGTLGYDHKRGHWFLCGWGDMIERPGNRGRFE